MFHIAGMGDFICRTLSDVARYKGWVVASCRYCPNKVRINAGELAYYCRHRHLALRWPDFAFHLKCRCGRRQPEVSFWPGAEADYLPLVNVPAPAPDGISQKAWYASDERGRKRLIRDARR